MRSQNFDVSVQYLPSRKRYVVVIDPTPVMKWWDVVNAREELKNVIRETAGTVDRKSAIMRKTFATLKQWSDKGILFPQNWNDGDDYIPLLKSEEPAA